MHTVILLLRLGRQVFGHQEKEIIADVQNPDNDISMSVNVLYEEVTFREQNLVLQENAAYCTTSECAS